MRGRTIWLIVGLCVLVVAVGAWVLRGDGDVQYRTAPAERGDIAYTISATGTPNAVVTVQVGSQVSGNIKALYADFNTKVQKGQVVAQIDPQLFQARVDQERANLNAAQAAVLNAQAQIRKNEADVASGRATLADAKSNVVKAQSAVGDAKSKLDRRLELVKEGVLAKEEGETAQTTYDQAQAMLESARSLVISAQTNITALQAQVEVANSQRATALAQVKQAEASLKQAEVDLENTVIRAPVDGVVVARQIDVGQTVAASMQAPTLFSIAQDLTRMQVDTNVSEADVGRVVAGQAADFTVDAYPGQVFHGKVTSIRKAPINVQNVVTYDVVIGVANPDLKLFPGMTANVKILIDRHKDVLKIPNAALRFHPADAAPRKTQRPAAGAGGARRPGANGQQTVWVMDGESRKPRPVQVTVGITDGNYTEISGGDLKAGDPAIVAAFSKSAGAAASNATPFSGGGGGAGGGRRGGL
jgi:HlyD family secretion protein